LPIPAVSSNRPADRRRQPAEHEFQQ
jgi:hypothetical protein